MRKLLLGLSLSFVPLTLLAQGNAPSTIELGTHGNNGDAADTGHSEIALTSSTYTLSPNEWWQEHINVSCGAAITAGEVVAPLNNGKHYVIKISTSCGHTVIVCGAPVVGSSLGTPSGACTDAIPDDGKMYWIATDGTNYGLASGTSSSGGSVASVFTRTGAVIAQAGDYSSFYAPSTNMSGGTNNYASYDGASTYTGLKNFTNGFVIGTSSTGPTAKAVFYQGLNGTAGQQSFVFADYNQFIVDSGNDPFVLAKQTTEATALTIQENGGSYTAAKWWYDGPSATDTGAWLTSGANLNLRLGDDAGADQVLFRNSDDTVVASVDSEGNAQISGAMTVGGYLNTDNGSLASDGYGTLRVNYLTAYSGLYTNDNTLDDGSGDAQINGQLLANQLYTSHNQLDDGSGAVNINGSFATDGGGVSTDGAGDLSAHNLSAYSLLYTNNNSLDDGSGNAFFQGSVSVDGAVGTGNSTFDDGSGNAYFGGNAIFVGDVTAPNVPNTVNNVAPVAGNISLPDTCGGPSCAAANQVNVAWGTTSNQFLTADDSGSATTLTFASTSWAPPVSYGGIACAVLGDNNPADNEKICFTGNNLSTHQLTGVVRARYNTSAVAHLVANNAYILGIVSLTATGGGYSAAPASFTTVDGNTTYPGQITASSVVASNITAFQRITATTLKSGLFTPTNSPVTNCDVGDWAHDANYVYTCTATNVWERSPLSTF